MKTLCPVCEGELPFEPWRGESASDEICTHCGIQFGYDDSRPDLRPHIYRRWREAWIANGRRAFHGSAWRDVSRRVATAALADLSPPKA